MYIIGVKEYMYKSIIKIEEFLNVEKPEIAYLLGLIWADGYLTKSPHVFITGLSTTEPDSDYFYDIFTTSGDWNIYKERRTLNWKIAVDIRTSNPFLHKLLDSLGYKEKHDAFLIINHIPENLRRFWLLGLIDGDGCWYTNKKNNCYQFCIAAAYDFDWSSVGSLFSAIDGVRFYIEQTKNKKGRGSVLRVNGRDNDILLGNYIYSSYKEDGIGLPRKYEKWLSMNREPVNTSHK